MPKGSSELPQAHRILSQVYTLYALIARPLSDVLKGNQKFYFGPEQEHTVSELKKALTTEPVLRIYRLDAMTELHTDASKVGYEAALLQRNNENFHPVYYMSQDF